MGWNNHPGGSIAALVGNPIGETPEQAMERSREAARKRLHPEINHLATLLENPENEAGAHNLSLPLIPQGERERAIRTKVANSINDFIRATNEKNRQNEEPSLPAIIKEGRLPEFTTGDLACMTTGDISGMSISGKIALAMYKNDIDTLFNTLQNILEATTKEATECPDMRRFMFADHAKRTLFILPIVVEGIRGQINGILDLPREVTYIFDKKTGDLILIEWGNTSKKHLHEEEFRSYDPLSQRCYEMFYGERNPVRVQTEMVLSGKMKHRHKRSKA